MKRLIEKIVFVGFVTCCRFAGATTSSLPGGTSISVSVSAPPSGATLPLLPTQTFNGSASVGQGAAVANTLLMYVVDVSGSTLDPQATTACGQQNVYDRQANTTL